jgi:ketosteroid isomerase-like protein
VIDMTDADADLKTLTAVRQALEAAENAGDADAAAAHFTDDIVLMVPDFPVQEGKAACLEFLRDLMGWLLAQYDRHITYVSAEAAIAGDMAFDRGTFSFTVTPRSGGEPTHVTGKYLWLLARTASQPWRVARLIVCRDDEAGRHDAGEAESAASTPT